MTRRVCALLDRWNITVGAGVECPVATGQWNIAADRYAFQTGNVVQRIQRLFDKTLPRRRVRILGRRQSDRAGPKIERTKTDVLLAQANETRDEQRRAGKKRDRKSDLRTNKNFSETLLAHAPAGSTAAFFQTVDQVSMRSLQGRINSHQKTSQQRKADGEEKDGPRDTRGRIFFQRQKIRRHSWHKRNQSPRDERAHRPGN